MFKFNDYPNLKKCHTQYEKYSRRMYQYDCPTDPKKELKVLESINDVRNYARTVYSKEIFDIFSKIKPTLMDRRIKRLIDWSCVFNDDFNKYSNDDKEKLVLLVEEYGSIYRLPKDFYK